MKAPNRIAAIGSDQQAIDGVNTELQGMPVMFLGGQMFTANSLAQRIQRRIDAANAVDAAKAAWLKAVSDYQALDRPTDVILRDLKRIVIGAFGDQSPKLAAFGFAIAKQAVFTEEQKAVMVAKRLATRKARGTMGPKAKLKIKGAVPATPATPTGGTTAK